MELAPAGVSLSFDVTFDAADLFVGMRVFEVLADGSYLEVGTVRATTLVADYTYSARFTAESGKSYVVIKSVYTDGTYTVLDSEYAAGSETIKAQYIDTGLSSGCSVLGFVDQLNTVIGYVDC